MLDTQFIIEILKLFLCEHAFLKHLLQDPLLLLVLKLFHKETNMAIDLNNQVCLLWVFLIPLVSVHSLHELDLLFYKRELLVFENLLKGLIVLCYRFCKLKFEQI